jgi:hypothetical protein
MLTGVTVSCFVLSYLLVLGLELSRWVLRMPFRMGLVVTLSLLGLLTHGLYLYDTITRQLTEQGPQYLLANWHDWAMVVSFGIAVTYLLLVWRRPESPVGTFVIPLILALIAAAVLLRSARPFERDTALSVWRWIHGVTLMGGTILVTLGFAVSLMYLLQSYRLKSKQIQSSKPRLPSLEYLQAIGSMCVYASVVFIGFGLVSGVVMNLQRNGQIAWTEGGVLFSGVVFLWLLAASFVEFRFARQGHWKWTAYINIGSFLCMATALALVVFTPHGRADEEPKPTSSQSMIPLRNETGAVS